MAPEYSGRGEGTRSMTLLWGLREGRRRGPRPGLSLDQIVRAAVELADRDGLEAVSMRRVADMLRVGTMTLYTYVPGKGELMDLMLDRVYGEHDLEGPGPPQADWRAALETVARHQWALYERHPWTLSIASGRSVLGPNEITSYEAVLARVEHLGLPARETVAMVDALSMFVRGAARDAAEARGATEATGISETQWWHEREAILSEVMTAERFPSLTRLGEAGGFDVPPDTPDYNLRFAMDDFEYGLARLLDGFEVAVARHGRQADSPRESDRGLATTYGSMGDSGSGVSAAAAPHSGGGPPSGSGGPA
jgi:AcrR family transcriptional regulator